MPELLEYIPDKLIDLSNDERQERAKFIHAGWQYYDGNMRKPLKVKPGQAVRKGQAMFMLLPLLTPEAERA